MPGASEVVWSGPTCGYWFGDLGEDAAELEHGSRRIERHARCDDRQLARPGISVERTLPPRSIERSSLARDERRRQVEEGGKALGRAFPAQLRCEIGSTGGGRIPLPKDRERGILQLGEAELGQGQRPPRRTEGHGDDALALGGAELGRMLRQD